MATCLQLMPANFIQEEYYMPTIVYQRGPNGQLYAYQSRSYWNKEKKAPRTRREYLGKVDENGNIIPKKIKEVPPQQDEPEPIAPVAKESTLSDSDAVLLLKEISAILKRMDTTMTSFVDAIKAAGNTAE